MSFLLQNQILSNLHQEHKVKFVPILLYLELYIHFSYLESA